MTMTSNPSPLVYRVTISSESNTLEKECLKTVSNPSVGSVRPSRHARTYINNQSALLKVELQLRGSVLLPLALS